MADEWASPAEGSPAPAGGSDYKSMELFPKVIVGLLALECVLYLAVSVLEPVSVVWMADALESGEGAGLALALLMVAAGGGLLFVIVALFPMWVYWHYRASANLRALGRFGLEFTPGWSAGWWFVPFANLVMPYRATLELWKGSDPDAEFDGDNWVLAPQPSWFAIWWGTWLGGNILQRVTSRLPEETGAIASLVLSPVALASLVLYLLIVKTVSERQEALARRLGKI